MAKTIRELWYGNIDPIDRCGAHDAQTIQLASLMERNRKALYSLTTSQQQEIFQKYVDCSEEYLLRQMELAFCSGFSLSCRFLTEAFSQCEE